MVGASHVTGPALSNGCQDGDLHLQAGEPRFDPQLDAWVLSRYVDVTSAFHSPDLLLIGPTSQAECPRVDEAARQRMRLDTRAALSPAVLRSLRKQMLSNARERVAQFGSERTIDLIGDYAEPLCRALAIKATQPDAVSIEHLVTLASEVSLAAEAPLDEQRKASAKAATVKLQPFFTKGPEPMRDSGFVALSQTLVRLLGSVWFALLSHPEEFNRLHTQPAFVARGMEELQRFAGLTRLLYRRAIADTTLNGLVIHKGERVILCPLAANRDPDRFPNPHDLSVMRPRIHHLSLGSGRHACVGAPLIRMATVIATLGLVERFPSLQLVSPIEWRGGDGFVSPVALPVLLPAAAASRPNGPGS
jgi:cytochrome P450